MKSDQNSFAGAGIPYSIILLTLLSLLSNTILILNSCIMFCSLQIQINNVVSVYCFIYLHFEDQTMNVGEKNKW